MASSSTDSNSSSSSTFPLPPALQTGVSAAVGAANLAQAGIRAVLLSTAEGVPLGRVAAPTEGMGGLPQPDLLPLLEAVLAPAAKQAPVLGRGRLRQVTAVYEHGTVVHLYQGPMVVTLLCRPGANLGAVRATAAPRLRAALAPLRTTLEASLKQPPEDGPSPALPLQQGGIGYR